jgi:hypothetical protein
LSRASKIRNSQGEQHSIRNAHREVRLSIEVGVHILHA